MVEFDNTRIHQNTEKKQMRRRGEAPARVLLDGLRVQLRHEKHWAARDHPLLDRGKEPAIEVLHLDRK